MRSARSFLVPLLAVSAVGCLDPLGPNDVDLTYNNHYVQRTKVDRVGAKEAGDLVALVPDGGVWEERALVHRGADGRFAIPEVPEGGRYFLRQGTDGGVYDYYDTDARIAKFEPRHLGAPPAKDVSGTRLEVISESASPYQGGGTFCLTSLSAGLGGVCSGWQQSDLASYLSVRLDLDSVKGSHRNADLLMPGDDLLLHQLDYTVIDDGTVWSRGTTARSVALGGVDMTQSPATTVEVDLKELDQDETLSTTYDRQSFNDVFSAAHPAAIAWGHEASVQLATQAGGIPMFLDGSAPYLAFVVLYSDDWDANVSVPYANPFAAPWTPVVRALSYARMQYQLPNPAGGMATPLNRYLYTSAEHLAASAPSQLTALLSPPSQIGVDGRPFFESGAIARAPRLQWSAPTVGTADTYYLRVYEMYVDGSANTRSRLIARFHTRETSLQLPPILRAGTKVTFLLSAEKGNLDPNDAIVTHTAFGLPGASSAASSAIMTVQP